MNFQENFIKTGTRKEQSDAIFSISYGRKIRLIPNNKY